jgi:hypothetical protein
MDPTLVWNDVVLEADRVSHSSAVGEQRGPVLSSRALAVTHLAMYDAFAGARGNPSDLPHYLPGLPARPPNVSEDEAVAGAAYTALSRLYPSQQAFFDLVLGLAGSSPTASHEYGFTVARAILSDRAGDPGAEATGYVAPTTRGSHRPDPQNPDQSFYAPFYGARSKGFAITDRHELRPPPGPGDQRYLAALKEVRAKGIQPELTGALPPNLQRDERTVDETVIGIYWAYDGAVGLGTPPRLYNQIIRRVAAKQGNTREMNARLFALVNVAMADAGILAWDQKYKHNLWRPVLGIREHDLSMGPGGEPANNISDNCDTQWLPLGAPNTNRGTGRDFTPNFPAYPSGHATFGAAAFQMTRLFYDCADRNTDNLFDGLFFVSDEYNGINRDSKGVVRPRHVRNFPRGLGQMIEENGRSRVFLGVHWLFDAFVTDDDGKPDYSQRVGGVPLGLTIAKDIFNGGREKGLKKSRVMPRS